MNKKLIFLILFTFLFSTMFLSVLNVNAAQSGEDLSKQMAESNNSNNSSNSEEEYYFDKNCTDAAPALRIGYLVIKVVRIAIPTIIVILGTFSLFSSILSGGVENFTKSIIKLLMQIVLAALIFFTPSIVNSIMSVMTTEKNSDMEVCRKCLFEDNCPVPEEDAWYDK